MRSLDNISATFSQVYLLYETKRERKETGKDGTVDKPSFVNRWRLTFCV